MSHTTRPCSPLCLDAGHCPACAPAAWAKVATPLRFLPPKNLPARFDYSAHERRRALNILINSAPAGVLRRTLQDHQLNGSGLYRIAPDGTLYICHREAVGYVADFVATSDWAVAIVQHQPDEEQWRLLDTPRHYGPRDAAHYAKDTPAGPVEFWIAVCELAECLHVEVQITSKSNGTHVLRDQVALGRESQDGHAKRVAEWVQDHVDAAKRAC